MVEKDLLGGAAVGALLAQLLNEVMKLIEKAVHFKPELEGLKSQVGFLMRLMDQVDELGEDFKLRYFDQTLKLKILINKGKQLIEECNDVAIQSTLSRYSKIPRYTKKLRKLDAELKSAQSNLMLALSVQQLLALERNYNNNGRTQILDKRPFRSEGGSTNNEYKIKLPLLFYHDKRLKGKAGANFVDAFVGRAVEHIKDDPKEGIEGRIEEKIKKWGEGRFEKIFHRTFETTIVAAEEKLHIWFACNLSTTREKGENIETVAVAGVLFVSSAKLAFCSLKPTPQYLKVVMPFELLKGFKFDEDQKYIRVIAIDDQKFEFMNFRNYNVAKEGIQHIPIAR
ncbi:uncharacterized protein LOC103484756 [Cucumis melo]|uniref:Uncharacterized protein LOC103484756 n=1 Tax=Cucumis melo TaxID=3656 RepID=A0A1S3B199_CUCME|nr:uncharacterized protein LOC103484756 [Cucumis melo]